MLALALLALPLETSKKGLQVQMVDDALELGIRHAAINVQIGDFVTTTPDSDDPKLDGTTVHLKSAVLKSLEPTVSSFRRNGVKLYVILLARATADKQLNDLILHPRFDPAAANKLAAFRTTDRAGEQLLASFCLYLQSRFRIDGWVVGNEVNSHEAWFNMGEASGDQVADAMERALRIVQRSVTPAKVYLSLDHFWTGRHMPEHLRKSLPGKEVLGKVAQLARRRGDFEWHVAHHPYPENLFEPRFWNDKTALLNFETPRITFKNLEVLTEYLKQPHLRFGGKARRVILSEQGFHRPDGVEGEQIQAAAYAYAWQRVVRNDGIDAFILHRHTDHAHEGGLRLGLWSNKPNSIADPDRRTKMWHVMKAAGTATEAQEFRFALPLVGLTDWSEADPKPVKR